MFLIHCCRFHESDQFLCFEQQFGLRPRRLVGRRKRLFPLKFVSPIQAFEWLTQKKQLNNTICFHNNWYTLTKHSRFCKRVSASITPETYSPLEPFAWTIYSFFPNLAFVSVQSCSGSESHI